MPIRSLTSGLPLPELPPDMEHNAQVIGLGGGQLDTEPDGQGPPGNRVAQRHSVVVVPLGATQPVVGGGDRMPRQPKDGGAADGDGEEGEQRSQLDGNLAQLKLGRSIGRPRSRTRSRVTVQRSKTKTSEAKGRRSPRTKSYIGNGNNGGLPRS